jgi:hypothetical protein
MQNRLKQRICRETTHVTSVHDGDYFAELVSVNYLK